MNRLLNNKHTNQAYKLWKIKFYVLNVGILQTEIQDI